MSAPPCSPATDTAAATAANQPTRRAARRRPPRRNHPAPARPPRPARPHAARRRTPRLPQPKRATPVDGGCLEPSIDALASPRLGSVGAEIGPSFRPSRILRREGEALKGRPRRPHNRAERSPVLALVKPAGVVGAPDPPADSLPETVEDWNRFWASPLPQAVDRVTDLPALRTAAPARTSVPKPVNHSVLSSQPSL